MRFILLSIILITSLPLKTYSQSADSMVTGKKYRITLFDEREYAGTIVSQNEKSVLLKTLNSQITIDRDNILSVSTDLSPTKYKFLATLNSGIVPNDFYDDSYTNYIINGRFSYFYSEKKTIGADISFTYFNRNNELTNGSGVEGGDKFYLDLLANLQTGTFEKGNIIDLYLNLGVGLQVNHLNSTTYRYYSFYDSSYYYSTSNAYTKFYPMIQIGGGLIIKPSYNFGLNLEFDIKAYAFSYILFPSEAYIPVKAGITYYFMKGE